MEDLKYNYFTVYLTDYSEENKAYKFFKKGLECFADSKSIIYKSDTFITTEEFEETIIKGTKFSSIKSEIVVGDLKQRIKDLYEEVVNINKTRKNSKFIIDWDKYPSVTKPEYKEQLKNMFDNFENNLNKPMKEVEAGLLQAKWWLDINDYVNK